MEDLGVELDNYDYMKDPDNANTLYEQVSNGWMPPSGSGEEPWTEEQVALFKQWMDDGYQP
jgi:hypothetical protein